MTAALACLIANGQRARAHVGPPFPILMDVPAAGHAVSVWADPDIGEAYFFIIVESPSGEPPPPQAPSVSMWVQPVDGRLKRASCPVRREDVRGRMQFEARPHFDQRDLWDVGVTIDPPNGEAVELLARVESTPPGIGPWGLVLYLFPFVLLGGMWLAALMRYRSHRRRHAVAGDPARRLEGGGGLLPLRVRTTPASVQSPSWRP